jgi:wyosine [tRNA(Phe)-imidazoG37] synthetase (radical SAM superfamily)
MQKNLSLKSRTVFAVAANRNSINISQGFSSINIPQGQEIVESVISLLQWMRKLATIHHPIHIKLIEPYNIKQEYVAPS